MKPTTISAVAGKRGLGAPAAASNVNDICIPLLSYLVV
jgi:hypothetical protein